MTDNPTPNDIALLREAHGWRRNEVQALGAALSCRNWHMMETAYNRLRDKMDAAGCWHEPKELAPGQHDGAAGEGQRKTRPDVLALRGAASNALMYLQTGFVECEWCGHEVPTAHLDAAYALADVVEPASETANPSGADALGDRL